MIPGVSIILSSGVGGRPYESIRGYNTSGDSQEGSGGMLPQKILKSRSQDYVISCILASNLVLNID